MARINSMGLDELLDDIVREHKAMPETMQKMLEAAGDEYVKATKHQLLVFKVFDMGTTHAAIKRGIVGKRGDGYRLEVWPSGTRRDKNHPDGERIETVAFVANYGTKRIRARPWATASAAEAEEPAAQAMLDVWERESKL